YDRDGRGLLLTDRLRPERGTTGLVGGLGLGSFTPVSAVDYYLRAARAVLDGTLSASEGSSAPNPSGSPSHALTASPDLPISQSPNLPRPIPLELATTPAQDAAAADILRKAGLAPQERYAIVNPGANDPGKRWPADRFGAVAAHLGAHHGLR